MRILSTKVLLSPIRPLSYIFKAGVIIIGLLHAAPLSAQQNPANVVNLNLDPLKTDKLVSQPASTKGPNLFVENPVFDFGQAKDKKMIQHTFILKNVGDAPLIISDVSTSCGCTTAGDFESEVAAGGKTELPVTFDPSSFGGEIHKLVIVKSNDPERPETYLRIQGHIWEPVEIDPTLISFKVSSSTKELKSQSFRLKNNLEQPLNPKIKKQSSQAAKIEISEVDPGKEYKILVQPVGPFGKKTEQISLTIDTGIQDPSEVNAQIVIIYEPDILLLPSKIRLSKDDQSDDGYTITILNRKNTTLKLNPKPLNIPGMTMSIKEVHSGRLYKVFLKVTDKLSMPENSDSFGAIQIETNNEELPLLTIPIVE